MTLLASVRRKQRHERIRKAVFGTAERPRLCVFRSSKHFYAQAIDDFRGHTGFAFSTLGEGFKKARVKANTVEGAKKLAQIFGTELVKKGIKKIVFDRAGYRYHGRVRAFAEGLREAGLQF